MDELSRYLLERYPNNYITGGDDCNFLIWGAEAAGRLAPEPKMCSLMVGLEYDPYDLSRAWVRNTLNRKYQNDLTFKKLFSYGREFAAGTSLPFMVIVYPSMRREFEDRWEDSRARYAPEQVLFYCHCITENRVARNILNGAGLKEAIYRDLGVNYTDTGTSKAKNKRLADYFHLWSRDSLTSRIIKFDLDGFLFSDQGGRSALVEFKRSSQTPWIPEWYPVYDKPDYILQYAFAKKIGAGFWLLHHERNPQRKEKYVSFFEIGGIEENEREYFLRFKQRAMRLPLHGERSLDSAVKRFIAAPDAAAFSGLCCPLCGAPVRYGASGYACAGRQAGSCGMDVGKSSDYELGESQIRALLAGSPVSCRHNGREVTLSPRVERNANNGRSTYQWKRG